MTETVEIQQECANCGCNVSFFLPATDTVEVRKALDVDDLAQEIRRVDGSNSLGAAALAEALMPFLSRPAAQEKEK